MRRLAAFMLACLFICLVPLAGAVPFLQHQANAARTGVVEDPGPERMDLAFRLALPEPPAPSSVPVIIDQGIYLLTETTLWRVDLGDAALDEILQGMQGPVSSLASDGQRLFYVSGDSLHASDVAGLPAWPAPVPVLPLTLPGDELACAPLAVAGDEILGACSRRQREGPLGDDGDPLVVFQVGRESGELIASWTRSMDDGSPVIDTTPDLYAEHAPGRPAQLAVAKDYVAVGERALFDVPWGSQARVWILDRAGLALRGVWNGPTLERAVEGAFRADPAFVQRETQNLASGLVAHDGLLLANSLDLVALDPADASVHWRQELREPSATDVDDPGALALLGNDIIALVPGGLTRADAVTSTPRWRIPAPVAGDAWLGTPGILVVGEHFFTGLWPEPHSLAGFAVGDGALSMLRATGATVDGLGVGEGVLAAVTGDTPNLGTGTSVQELLVFGSPPAAIGLDVSLSDLYPQIGKPVRLELDVRPGVLAEGWQATVDWGDGTATPPAQTTRFEHAYQERVQREIIVSVTNEAGQEASWSTTVFVGEQPPNFISNAFSPENQESTFFILGLVILLLGSAFGVARLRGRRRRLRRELATADAIVTQHRDDPDTMREELREHRLRARRLFLAGRLDEGSTGILERHIDELLRDHRLSRVEADLSFLPHGLFRSMQEMLRDARVTELEKVQFLRSLAAERGLTAGQKGKVKRHVETWHREDVV